MGSARSFGGTLREFLYQSREHVGLHGVFVGVPEQLADRIEDWFRSGAVDGFILMPDAMPSSLQVIANELATLLRRRGLLREEYIPGATLRDNLLEGSRI
ncbi:hypothetical protein [Gordonia sp. NB41Y]|uniref:hypothetical protein n=1 Tax=Gordonia sp. NB41Y TaxID=875808 RepID=UPI0006B227DD|nr:hypothetical protein [Gordonia sp. NB41Y]KOY48977.1 hypothetical protein ISGA_13170 [Gordonia sp. NB41Y]WLP88437.1 hypothetical protein Q9K23_12400 [Gordonia sp. NB41Y]